MSTNEQKRKGVFGIMELLMRRRIFLLKLAEEDGCKYGGEGSWFLPYDRSDVREEDYGLYTYNGLLNGDITYEAILISDMS